MFVIAVLEEDVLEKIYELTYKYGWIMQEEKMEGYLSDKTYRTKYRIEGELAEVLAIGMGELINTYKEWLGQHTREGFVDYYSQQAEETGLDSVLGWLSGLGIIPKDSLYSAVVRSMGGSEQMLRNEDMEFLKESNGEQFVSDYLAKHPEHVDAFNKLSEEEARTDLAASRFIEDEGLEEDLIQWLLETGWTGEEWLKDMYRPQDLLEQYGSSMLASVSTILEEAYEPYLDHFETGGEMDKPLREAIRDIEDTLEILEAAQNASLDERIKAFQLGLTTAHWSGTMADHLLDVGRGRGEAILDMLSGGPHVEEWNEDLNKLLGYYPGSKSRVAPLEWFDPEQEEVLRRNQSLNLCACVAAVLYL